MEPIVLTHMERLAAIRAYDTPAKLHLTRAQIVDRIIGAINEERASAKADL